MLSEFRTFIAQGNVLDLAVGVIIGAAFGKIVNSFIEDIVNPILGLVMGGADLSELKYVLKTAAGGAPEVAIRYGSFLNTCLQFLLIAWVLFLLVKVANRARLTGTAAS